MLNKLEELAEYLSNSKVFLAFCVVYGVLSGMLLTYVLFLLYLYS